MMKKPFQVYTENDWQYFTKEHFEGQWFECKAHPINKTPSGLKSFCKGKIAGRICSFANSNPDVGGLLIIGIDDEGKVVGIDQHGQSYINEILSYHEFLDGPKPQDKIVECVREDGNRDHLIFIYTPFLQNRVARTTDGECWVRKGDKTHQLKAHEYQNLAYSKGELQFEDEPALPFNEQDLESGVVKEFITQYSQKKRFEETPTIERLLRLARLIMTRDDQIYLTKGGLVVFHKDPRVVIPGAYVRYLRYDGRDRDAMLIRDETFEGPLPTVIQKLREFIPTQLARFSFRTENGSLTSQDEYPREAWDEAIVNALVHRSYSQQTRPVRITHFEDRFEITSPGSYPLGVTPDNFIHTPRNTNLMEALRYLDFVRMAEEGIRTMRRVMLEAGLPAPEYSPPELDHVTCTLYNNIDKRTQALTNAATRAAITPTTVVPNIYQLKLRSPLPEDLNAPFAEESGRPTFGQIRNALHTALQKAGFRIDSFAGVIAVNFQDEYTVPALVGSKLAAIYPGIEFRLRQFDRSFYLIVDYTVEVRNRANVDRIMRLLPWLRIDNHRKCFVRHQSGWLAGYIVGVSNDSCYIELTAKRGAQSPTTLKAQTNEVIPQLSIVELTTLLETEEIHVNLVQEVRKASLIDTSDAPRRRQEKITQIVRTLSRRVFPLVISPHEILISETSAEVNQPPLLMGQDLQEPKIQFDSKGNRQDEDILRGLTTFGAFEKPLQEIPLVTICPERWAAKMQAFIARLRSGDQRFRGIEKTFGIRSGNITTVIAETHEYETKAGETISQLPEDVKPVFIVFAPERGISRANYSSSYYRLKHFLLESGYPSQMVKESTLEDPKWKDLNFALDIFAKAGYVPWVLSEGMPKADLFIGLSSSIITYKGQRQRILGYANVFDDFGRWLFYRGAPDSVKFEQRNEMFNSLLRRVTKEYQAVKRKLQWVHIHHSAKLRWKDREEIARGVLAEAPEAEISFVHINRRNAFRLFDKSPKGDGAAKRGTWVILSPNTFIINTIGPNPLGQKYMGTPRPLEIRVNRINTSGKLDLAIYAQHILSLTRLNWASTRSFSHDPITIKFANEIAYLMNAFLIIGGTFRLHDSLRDTPWFL